MNLECMFSELWEEITHQEGPPKLGIFSLSVIGWLRYWPVDASQVWECCLTQEVSSHWLATKRRLGFKGTSYEDSRFQIRSSHPANNTRAVLSPNVSVDFLFVSLFGPQVEVVHLAFWIFGFQGFGCVRGPFHLVLLMSVWVIYSLISFNWAALI